MRIIAGKLKNLQLDTVNTISTRPMMSRVKESLFSSIQSQIAEAKVLDLFAGSGSLGIECLSRGASSCKFVELSNETATILIKNIGRAETKPIVYVEDAYKWVNKHKECFDIIFVDPPFGHSDLIVTQLLSDLYNNLYNKGTLIVHRDNTSNIINFVHNLELIKKRKFGQSIIYIYKKDEK